MGEKLERRVRSWARNGAPRRTWELRQLRKPMSGATSSLQASGLLSGLLVAVKLEGFWARHWTRILSELVPKLLEPQWSHLGSHRSSCIQDDACAGTSPSREAFELLFPCLGHPSRPRHTVTLVLSPCWSLQAAISQVKRRYSSCTAAFPRGGGKAEPGWH